MKKRKFAKRTAYSIIAGATLASAAFLPGCNRPESVYGPPPGATTQAQEESSFQSQTSAQEQTTEISSEYDTTENIPETVYGPPEDFGLPADEYDPDENELEDVYGPPEYFGLPEDEFDTDESLPEEMDPNPPLYGPAPED